MDVFAHGLAWARETCLRLPDAYEEQAWVGSRWMVRKHTFAHLVEIADGNPRSFAIAAATPGPATVLVLRAHGDELGALLARSEFFGPLWGRDDLGVRLDASTDWDELAELVTDSYRLRAPQLLLRLLDERPPRHAV